jgi:WD40 repeat protein
MGRVFTAIRPLLPSHPPFPCHVHSARVWDAITGAELHSFTHGHIVKTVEFSPDSRRFISGGHEVCVCVCIACVCISVHTKIGFLTSALLLRTHSAPNQGIIRLFDLIEPEAAPAMISLPSKGTHITKIVWSRGDPQRVLTGGNDGRIRAWDLRTQQEVQAAQVDGACGLISRLIHMRLPWRSSASHAGPPSYLLCLMSSIPPQTPKIQAR